VFPLNVISEVLKRPKRFYRQTQLASVLQQALILHVDVCIFRENFVLTIHTKTWCVYLFKFLPLA